MSIYSMQENIGFRIFCMGIAQLLNSQSAGIGDYVPVNFNYRNHMVEVQEAMMKEYIRALGLSESDARKEVNFFMEFDLRGRMPEKSYYVRGKNVDVIAANPEEAVILAKESDEFMNRFAPYLSKPFNSKHYVIALNRDSDSARLNASYKPGSNVVVGQVYNEKGNSTLEKDALYHELGHSLLDNIAPRAGSCFHEAFADIMTFLNQASKPDQIKDIKDFRKSNRISQIAENTAVAKDREINYLRDLAEQHRYNLLDEYEAGSAVAGAFYKTWANYVESLKARGIPQEEAVKMANDKFSRVAIKAAEDLANHEKPLAIHYAESILKNLDSDPEIKKLYYKELEKIEYQEALKYYEKSKNGWDKETLYTIYEESKVSNTFCNTISKVINSQSKVKDYVPISFNYKDYMFEIQKALEKEYMRALDALDLEGKFNPKDLTDTYMKSIKVLMPEKSYYVRGKKVEVIAANPEEAVKLAKESDEFMNRFTRHISKPFNSKHYIMTIKGEKDLNASYLTGENVVKGQVYNKNGNSTLEGDVLYHELGHLLLDNIVPQADMSFGEAFADIMAFLNQASKPDQIRDIKDFRKSNRISQIAENSVIAKQGKESYLRDLAGEHRYSMYNNVYESGAAVASSFYKAWANYVENLKSKGIPQEKAVKIANEKFSRVAIKAAEDLANHKQPSALDYAESILKNLDSDPEIKKLYYSELEKIGYQEVLKDLEYIKEQARKYESQHYSDRW
ncbi:MAG: hypothetical protein ABDH21_02880 [bacterium]